GRRGSADGRVGSAADVDANAGVLDRGGAGGIGADVVPGNDVSGGGAAAQYDAAARIAGDDVACCGGGPADGVEAAGDIDASVAAVAQGHRAGGIRADQVALNDVMDGEVAGARVVD